MTHLFPKTQHFYQNSEKFIIQVAITCAVTIPKQSGKCLPGLQQNRTVCCASSKNTSYPFRCLPVLHVELQSRQLWVDGLPVNVDPLHNKCHLQTIQFLLQPHTFRASHNPPFTPFPFPYPIHADSNSQKWQKFSKPPIRMNFLILHIPSLDKWKYHLGDGTASRRFLRMRHWRYFEV